MKKALALMIVVLVLSVITACGSGKAEATETETAEETTAEVKETVPVTPEGEYVDIKIRDYGTITVKLDHDAAPETVDNFLRLTASGFYDGLTFHRIISGFMMQGGDPTGTGSGGSDTCIKGEFADNGWDNPISHVAGTISMARGSDYNSASSQFFIVHKDNQFLDGQYAAFGCVTEGMDVVDKICEDAKPVDNNGTIPAENQPIIESITIR
ncbi:MAG: peptidylprolyl isomerase [Lachnospiraceae bacterium]|nr:peptidylprolyl isomerase [Lachnospiraceae bacterium]